MGKLGPENMQHLPWILATGAISNGDNSPGTFDIDPNQYTSAFKDLKGIAHSPHLCSYRCYVKAIQECKAFFQDWPLHLYHWSSHMVTICTCRG